MESSSSGIASSSCSISVPFPTPEGPVITKTFPMALIMTAATAAKNCWRVALFPQLCDEFGALALGEAADRLRRRDPALVEDPIRLYPAVLGHRHQHVDHLGGLHVLGRIHEQRLDLDLAALQVALQLGPLGTDVICPLQGFHPLVQ